MMLAWAAGFVDSLGFLALSHEFTAHMSGNAAVTGAELGSGNYYETLLVFSPIPGFVFGVCLGAAVRIWAKSKNWRSPFLVVLLMECALLVCFILLAVTHTYPPIKGSARFFAQVEILSLAMGLQAAALRSFQDIKVSTTFVTGMLTNMSEEFTRYLLSPRGDTSRRDAGLHATLFGGIFLSFIVGGVAGAIAHRNAGPWALVIPLILLLLLAASEMKSSPPQKSVDPR